MNARPWVWLFTMLLLAGSLSLSADDRARRREGASDRDRSAGERHHAGRSDGAARSGGGGERAVPVGEAQRPSRDRGDSADRGRDAGARGRGESAGRDRDPASGARGGRGRDFDDPPVRRVTGAEARHPEAGTGHGWRTGRYGYYYSGRPYYFSSYRSPYYFYRPYYWGFYGVPYYDLYWSSGYDPYWYSGSYSYRDRYRYRSSDTASIRTLVDPDKTKVFVDGYYAGTSDDFDGLFQRLYVSPGRHDIAFKLEGYRTYVVKVYATEDHTIKIRHDMERGSGPDAVVDLTGGLEEPPYRVGRNDDRYPSRDDDRRDVERRDNDRRDDDREADQGREARDAGTLRVDVRPDDASIYVDGEFFGTARRASSLALPPGRHRVEVVRPGYRTVEREVEVRPGRTETVTIDLERS